MMGRSTIDMNRNGSVNLEVAHELGFIGGGKQSYGSSEHPLSRYYLEETPAKGYYNCSIQSI